MYFLLYQMLYKPLWSKDQYFPFVLERFMYTCSSREDKMYTSIVFLAFTLSNKDFILFPKAIDLIDTLWSMFYKPWWSSSF